MAPEGAIFYLPTSYYARQTAGRYLAAKVPPVQDHTIEPPVGTLDAVAVPPESAAPPEDGVNKMVPLPAAAV